MKYKVLDITRHDTFQGYVVVPIDEYKKYTDRGGDVDRWGELVDEQWHDYTDYEIEDEFLIDIPDEKVQEYNEAQVVDFETIENWIIHERDE